MKRTMRTSVILHRGTTVAALRDALEDVPDEASVTAHVSEGDRPWESATTTLDFTWVVGE